MAIGGLLLSVLALAVRALVVLGGVDISTTFRTVNFGAYVVGLLASLLAGFAGLAVVLIAGTVRSFTPWLMRKPLLPARLASTLRSDPVLVATVGLSPKMGERGLEVMSKEVEAAVWHHVIQSFRTPYFTSVASLNRRRRGRSGTMYLSSSPGVSSIADGLPRERLRIVSVVSADGERWTAIESVEAGQPLEQRPGWLAVALLAPVGLAAIAPLYLGLDVGSPWTEWLFSIPLAAYGFSFTYSLSFHLRMRSDWPSGLLLELGGALMFGAVIETLRTVGSLYRTQGR